MALASDLWQTYGLRVTVQPVVEPVSLDQFKLSQRITHDDEDSLLVGYLLAARQYVEDWTRRKLITQSCTWTLDEFPYYELRFPVAPVQSVTSIQYVDVAGTTQTWSSSKYQVDIYRGRICPAYGEIWPITRPQMNAVTVTFVAGYGGASAVPELAKRCVILLAANLYENREPIVIGPAPKVVPHALEAILLLLSVGTYP